MPDYNFQIYDSSGKLAIPSVHNTYYIHSEFNVSPYGGPYGGFASTMVIGLAQIVVPIAPNNYQAPLILVKNDPNQAAVGLWGSYYSGGQFTDIRIAMEWGKPLTVAIAMAETGSTVDTPYGMQVFDPSGNNIIYDSRRPKQLASKGAISLPSGWVVGSGTAPDGYFEYLSTPMHHHGIWKWLNQQWFHEIGTGLVMVKGSGGDQVIAYPSLHDVWLSEDYISQGGGPSTGVLLFSKV